MEKLIYLLWARNGQDCEAGRKLLLDQVAPAWLAKGARGLSMNIDDADADVPAPVPAPEGEAQIAATASLWLDCVDFRGPYEDVLADAGLRAAGYLVTESLYTDYGDNEFAAPRSWPDGERSPGVTIVTLMERPERLSREDWIAHWHGMQSSVSASMQPRTRYVRNAVARALAPGAPPYEGIVEECWPSAEHRADPMLFYCANGSKERLKQNVEKMMASVTAFLDLDRIRTITMSEYLLKT